MSNRRDFLRKTLAGAAAISLPGALSNKALATDFVNRDSAYGKPLPVSCLSYSFNGLVREGMMDVFGYFETCRYRYGLDAADLWVGMIRQAETDDDFVNKVHRALKERQLVIPNIACDGSHLIDSTNRDTPEGRAALRAKQDRWLKICKQWGVGFLRCDAGPMPGDGTPVENTPWSQENFDYLVKRYRELAQFAYDNGFKVGAENHQGQEKYWPNMEKLIKAVDHPGFGICVDFRQWFPNSEETRLQDNDTADRGALPYLCHTHFKWDIIENTELFLGKMKMLYNGGYKGYYSAEHNSRQNEYNLTLIQITKIRSVLTNLINGGAGEFIPPRD